MSRWPPCSPRRHAALALALVAAVAVQAHSGGAAAEPPGVGEPAASPPADTVAFLAAQGVRVSGGAAPGYVDDQVCGACHAELAASFAAVGMGRSFYRPSRERSIETFGEPFEHVPSRRWYEMVWRGEQLVFRRWQLGLQGEPVSELEQVVDWVLGSGNRSRTYLVRSPSGELWQLPIAWYTQERRWAMAPGYDRPDHLELQRAAQRECLFCHNAYPEIPAGGDRFATPHRFPSELPEGIGCQRCHGPGAEHVRRLRDPTLPFEQAGAAILNPARLPPARRNEVCLQCHLQPLVAVPAQRNFARGDFSFRPGEALAAHRVELDADEEGTPRAERFEINHHPYRLMQSRCFVASAGELSCLTCHDPHRKVEPARRAAHYRAACLSCHQPEQCPTERADGAAGHATTTAAVAAGAVPPDPSHAAAADCTSCHMPERRPQDVVHVLMTDHKIQLPRPGVDLTAPLAERREAGALEIFLKHPEEAPAGWRGHLYLAAGALRAEGRDAGVPVLERLLPAHQVAEPEPWLRLAEAQLYQRRASAAEQSVRRALALLEATDGERTEAAASALAPPESTALPRVWLGIALFSQGRREAGLAELERAVALDPLLVAARFDLGRLLLAVGRPADALPHLQRAVELRPTLPVGWLRLGEAQAALGAGGPALASYRRALALEPSTTEAWLALARHLHAAGAGSEAVEAFALGARYARRPEVVRAAAREAGVERAVLGLEAKAPWGSGSP